MVRSRARLVAQASVEWVLIVAIVGLGCVAGFRALSGEMGSVLGNTSNVLAQGDPVGPVEPDPGTPGGSGTGGGEEPAPEPEPEATNETAYAMLYEDGSMIFQIDDEEDSGHGALVGKWNGWLDTEVPTDTEIGPGDSSTAPAPMVPWFDKHLQIKSVSFKTRIAPISTAWWFYGCRNLSNIDLSNLDTSRTTNMHDMFRECSSLNSVNLSSLDTSKVVNIRGFFRSCSGLTDIDLAGLDLSSAENIGGLFLDCSSLTSINLSGLDTSKAYRLDGMFAGCKALVSADISSFDMKSSVIIEAMFSTCPSLSSLTVGSGFRVAKDHGNWIGGTWSDSNGATFTAETFPSGVAGTYTKVE